MIVSQFRNIKSLLLAATMIASPLTLFAAPPAAAQIGISVALAPPMLPIYAQPAIPGAGYIWTPGYWHWNEAEAYYWVPGTWVRPPRVGVLWTPPYWGNEGGRYLFHDGYWGTHVGFYGGINYGFGYGGVGFEGGRWQGRGFVYNSAVNNFGTVRIRDSYVRNVTAVNNSRVAFVGGEGGLRAVPTAEERGEERQQHFAATAEQTNHVGAAARNPELSANQNHGQPKIAATARPGKFAADSNDRQQPGHKQGNADQPQARHGAVANAEAHNRGQRPDAAKHGTVGLDVPPRRSRRLVIKGRAVSRRPAINRPDKATRNPIIRRLPIGMPRPSRRIPLPERQAKADKPEKK